MVVIWFSYFMLPIVVELFAVFFFTRPLTQGPLVVYIHLSCLSYDLQENWLHQTCTNCYINARDVVATACTCILNNAVFSCGSQGFAIVAF